MLNCQIFLAGCLRKRDSNCLKVQPGFCLCEGAKQLHKQHKLQFFNSTLNFSCDTLVRKWLKTLFKILMLCLRYFEEQTKRNSREWGGHTDICVTRSSIAGMIHMAEQKKQIKNTCVLWFSMSHYEGAGTQCSWWFHHVTSSPEWGNRRWHLADSLVLACRSPGAGLITVILKLHSWWTRSFWEWKKKKKWVKLGLSLPVETGRVKRSCLFPLDGWDIIT